MPYVPSRHTYMASVGRALLMAAALLELRARTMPSYGKAAIALISAVIVAHQCSYLWIKKQAQFEVRARPTEELLRIAEKSGVPVYVKCFPYDHSVADLALRIRGHDSRGATVVFGPAAASHPSSVDLCTELR